MNPQENGIQVSLLSVLSVKYIFGRLKLPWIVAEMVQAGNCWITPGSMDDTYTSQILHGLENGDIDEGRLRENVAGIIKTLVRFV